MDGFTSSHYSQAISLILGDLGCHYPSRKEEKLGLEEIMDHCRDIGSARNDAKCKQLKMIYVMHCNGILHSFMWLSLHCILCDRGQQEDRFIPVQFRAITHCLLAYVFCFCYADRELKRPPSASVATKDLLAGAIPAGNVIFDLFFFISCSWHISHCQNKLWLIRLDFTIAAVELDGSNLPCRFDLIYHCLMQSYGVKCLLILCFFILQTYFKSSRPSLRFAWFQRNRPIHPSNTSINNSHPSTIHSTNRRSTQSMNSKKE